MNLTPKERWAQAWIEHQLISAHYGDGRAKRSGVRLMNHIDEGLKILEKLGASERAARAFCLHPLFQTDKDLLNTYGTDLSVYDPYVLTLVVEYRNTANAALSVRDIIHPSEIELSPLEEVNDMLRADKLQNYKDFLKYHSKTHPRAMALDIYFRCWIQRLGVVDVYV